MLKTISIKFVSQKKFFFDEIKTNINSKEASGIQKQLSGKTILKLSLTCLIQEDIRSGE